jgi:uncharacterized protein
MTSPLAAPTRGGPPERPATTRQHFPDEIRGLALLGIAVVNAPFLATSLDGFAGRGDASSQAAWFLVTVLFLGKFYLIFAFLFGYSATLMMRGADRVARTRFARRLAGLAALGVAHALLLFLGDILVLYSVLGVALVILVTRGDRAVLRTAVAATAVAAAWLVVVVALATTTDARGDGAQTELTSSFDEAMSGSFGEAVVARWELYGSVLVLLLTLNGGLSLAMFCLGLVAGRRRLLADPDPASPLWRRARRWGLVVGLPLALVAGALSLRGGDDTGWLMLGLAVGFVGAPALTAGYLGLLVALRARRRSALAVFRPAGRMSLTIYVGESLLLSAVVNGWGLGLFGQLDPFAVLGLAVAAWAALDLLAHLWMRRFTQGPLEYLLRWWTYGRRPRLRAG